MSQREDLIIYLVQEQVSGAVDCAVASTTSPYFAVGRLVVELERRLFWRLAGALPGHLHRVAEHLGVEADLSAVRERLLADSTEEVERRMLERARATRGWRPLARPAEMVGAGDRRTTAASCP